MAFESHGSRNYETLVPLSIEYGKEAVSITNCKRSGSADAGDYPNIAKQTVGELKAA